MNFFFFGGTGRGRKHAPGGACPLRSRLTLPPLYPAGGLPSLSPAAPAFGLLYRPHPPTPLPGGKGELFSLFRRGLRPRHPCPEPPAALARRAFVVLVGRVRGWSLADPAAAVPGGVACLLCRPPTLPLACYIAPIPRPPSRREGGDSKIILPGATAPGTPCTEPLAALTDLAVLVPGGIPCREPLPVGFAANYGFSHGNARGEAPCIRKLKVSPFPPGRGLGGLGATKTTNGRGSGRQRRQAPPADTTAARSTGDQPGKPPASDTATAGRAGNEKTPPHPKRNPFHS